MPAFFSNQQMDGCVLFCGSRYLTYERLKNLTGDEEELLGFGLLQRAPSVLLVGAAAQGLQGLLDHRLQPRRFLPQRLDTRDISDTPHTFTGVTRKSSRRGVAPTVIFSLVLTEV